MVNADAAAAGRLKELLKGRSLAIAFSGGLDSRFLAFSAQRAGADVLLLHVTGPHIPPAETAYALQWAENHGLHCLSIPFDPLQKDEVKQNGRERCYACKAALFAAVSRKLMECGGAGRTLCDGTHAGDLRVWRPGLRALREAGVLSPLAEAGLDKAAIRRAAHMQGMDNAEQRARPCLLTRLAYGLAPDAALLRRIAEAEDAVAQALQAVTGEEKMPDFRLRITPRPVLQCTPLSDVARAAVLAALQGTAFAEARLLEENAVSGFFDRQHETALP